MSKIPSIPPNIPLPEVPKLSEDEIKSLKTGEASQNPALQKYEKRIKLKKQRESAKELRAKKERRSEWWRNNWVAFFAMIFAFISALPYIIQGISTILKLLGLSN